MRPPKKRHDIHEPTISDGAGYMKKPEQNIAPAEIQCG